MALVDPEQKNNLQIYFCFRNTHALGIRIFVADER